MRLKSALLVTGIAAAALFGASPVLADAAAPLPQGPAEDVSTPPFPAPVEPSEAPGDPQAPGEDVPSPAPVEPTEAPSPVPPSDAPGAPPQAVPADPVERDPNYTG